MEVAMLTRSVWCRLILIGCFCILFPGCNSTELVGAQLSEGYKDAHFQKILVIGIGTRVDLRRNYEDQFASQLAARGVEAIPGYELLPGGGEVDRVTLEAAVEKSGAQAVLITRLVKVKQTTAASASMDPSFTPGVWGSYGEAWNGFYEPPQSGGQFNPLPQPYTDTSAVLETKLIDARTGDTVWTAHTTTFSASAGERNVPGLVKVLVNGLAKDGLI